MKKLFKKSNTKFSPFRNYLLEDILEDIKKQKRDYLSHSIDFHVNEQLESIKRWASHLTVNIDNIVKNITEFHEKAEEFLHITVEDYYTNFAYLTCETTDEKIPYNTDYYLLSFDNEEEDYLIFSVEGLKELNKEILILI